MISSKFLLANNVTSYSLKMSPKVDDMMAKNLEEFLQKSLKEVGTVIFAKSVKRGEKNVVDLALMDYCVEPYAHLHVTLAYNVDDVPKPSKDVPKPEVLLNIIEQSKNECQIICEAEFTYENSIEKSVIKLPITLFRSDKFNFNKITAIRLLNEESGNSVSEISISVEEDGTITHELVLKQDIVFNKQTELNLLKQATEISKNFLI